MACAAFVAACDEATSRVAPSPVVPSVTSVQLDGPASVPPGESAQFTAIIHLADGSTKLATGATGVSWRTSTTDVLRVDANGVATALEGTGETTLTVAVTPRGNSNLTRSASRVVIVAPDGTYRLAGSVVDASNASTRLAGATVEAIPGPAATTTDSSGTYRLYGVPPTALIRVTRSGYATAERTVQLTGNATEHFSLTPSGPPLSLNGPYTLTLDVTGTCTSTFPAGLRHRQYEATLTQSGTTITVTLTEPRFRINGDNRGNTFTGRADPGGVTFQLDRYSSYYYFYYYWATYPNIVEHVPGDTYLAPWGTAVATGTATGLSGQLVGGVELFRSTFPAFNSLMATCNSMPIEFALTPR